jgi:hypothetical protein
MDSFGYELTRDNKVIITKFIGSRNPSIIVPAKLFGREVVGISDNSFHADERLIGSVEIQNGIRFIGKHAFSGCDELQKIIIPASMDEIGDGAFSECSSLEEVKFMGNAPKVGKDIFKNSMFVKVSYYATARGWDSSAFAGRQAVQIAETSTFMSASDDEDQDRPSDDFFGEDALLPDVEEQEYVDEEAMFEYEEPRYMTEVNVYQRVGVGTVATTSLKNVTNPIEAFRLRVGGVFTKIKHTSKLSETELVRMLEPISNIPNIRFKNPAGYLLGYIASEKGKGLTRAGFESARSLLEMINETKVIITPPDIVRYAMFWVSIKERYLRDS